MTNNDKRRNTSFPVLGVLAGLVFIIAGIGAFFHFELGFSIAIVFIFAGAAVVLVGLAGFRIRSWDLILFIIGLIILANVAGFNYYETNTYETSLYSVSSAYVNVPVIDILANSGVGSINVNFSSNNNIAYQVVFRSTFFGFPLFNFNTTSSLTNQTRNGVLYLNASSQGSITITIGAKYAVNINATTTVGSINVVSPSGANTNVRSVSLVTGTGSVDAQIDSRNISGITLKSGTGSLELSSNYLDASTSQVPISVTSGTGSININIMFANDAAVKIDASSGLGSTSQHLKGFTIDTNSNNHLIASVGDVGSATGSFVVTASVGTGSINIDGQLVQA